jgi:hypothetical protein
MISARIPTARVNWSSDMETILGGANGSSHKSAIRRGRTLTPGCVRFAFGARHRTVCLGPRTSLPIPNRSPFRTVPLTLKLGKWWSGGGRSIEVGRSRPAARLPRRDTSGAHSGRTPHSHSRTSWRLLPRCSGRRYISPTAAGLAKAERVFGAPNGPVMDSHRRNTAQGDGLARSRA